MLHHWNIWLAYVDILFLKSKSREIYMKNKSLFICFYINSKSNDY